jgi:bacteriorhodopsin
MFGVFYKLACVGRRAFKLLGNDVHQVYMRCGVLTLFTWMLYRVAWGLCEGGNVITLNDEAAFYRCLSLNAKPVLSIMSVHGHRGTATLDHQAYIVHKRDGL